MIKILHITGAFPNRSESWVIRQILGVREAGLEVEVLALSRGQDPVESMGEEAESVAETISYARECHGGALSRVLTMLDIILRHPEKLIKWIRLGWVSFRDPCHRYITYFTLAEAVLSLKPFDLVHVQFGHNGRLMALLKKLGFYQAPLVVVFHGGDSTLVLKERPGHYRDVYPYIDRLLTVSEALKKIHIREGCPEEKITVFMLGIQEDLWPYRPHFDNKESLNLLGVGRLVEKKGFGVVIRALGQLKEREMAVRFQIAGDGPLLEELKALASECGVEDRVKFSGWVTHGQLPALINESDVLVVPSIRGKDGDEEGLPTVIKEAMASGILVVGSRHSGIPELVHDNETGYLIDEGDVNGWVECLQHLSEKGCDFAMLNRARQLVLDRCGQEASTTALLRVYSHLVENRHIEELVSKPTGPRKYERR